MPRQSNSKVSLVKKPIPILSPALPPAVITNNTTLFQSVKEGFGFGIGSTIARNLFSVPTNVSSKQPSCIEYNKCLESNDKYECFGNLDQKEYVECRSKFN